MSHARGETFAVRVIFIWNGNRVSEHNLIQSFIESIAYEISNILTVVKFLHLEVHLSKAQTKTNHWVTNLGCQEDVGGFRNSYFRVFILQNRCVLPGVFIEKEDFFEDWLSISKAYSHLKRDFMNRTE